MYHLTALVTLLAIAFYFFTAINVSRSRTRTGVKVPAMSGHPDFERAFRIQMNTLEWMPIVLPALWLFAVYIGDAAAAGLGAVWIVGRVVYFIGYSKAAAKRGPGFMIQGVAAMAPWAGALGAVVLRLVK
ncbi:MAPEG family protein [Bradyrhizobium sp. CCBAU 53351]|uniref:MAPEG family protein n=1 Tax=Bradyrhizobium sp. CCBAU 53351 TaxID=1325114 RepID=UPI001887EB46|nr:MAPEG family protein [Bradyrhizobium sp. CCBAU 53351]QOZ80032.1 MAPEG family protein [Bradyrhizobium sp. CCBAU 53351]